MIKNLITVVVGLAVLAAIYAFVIPVLHKNGPQAVACTEEAMICPDGTAVGRTGPNCEFAKCPVAQSAPTPTELGTVEVTALLGPTCPVMKNPPDPKCADKSYAGYFELYAGAVTKSVHTDSLGKATVQIPPGTYVLGSTRETTLPRCASVENIVVTAGHTTAVSVSCDTGIR